MGTDSAYKKTPVKTEAYLIYMAEKEGFEPSIRY